VSIKAYEQSKAIVIRRFLVWIPAFLRDLCPQKRGYAKVAGMTAFVCFALLNVILRIWQALRLFNKLRVGQNLLSPFLSVRLPKPCGFWKANAITSERRDRRSLLRLDLKANLPNL
jgi:hypothetical protein